MSHSPSPSPSDALAHAGTGPVSDALLNLGRPHQVLTGLRAYGGSSCVAGPAVTVQQVPYAGGGTRQLEVVDTIADPGAVVVIDAQARTDVATFGSLIAERAQLRGLAALVVNGCCRDVEDLSALDLPILATGSSPRGSREALQTAALNEPIEINGVRVEPGDIIVADPTGAVCVPQAIVAQAAAEATRLADIESDVRARIHAGGELKAAFADAKEAAEDQR